MHCIHSGNQSLGWGASLGKEEENGEIIKDGVSELEWEGWSLSD